MFRWEESNKTRNTSILEKLCDDQNDSKIYLDIYPMTLLADWIILNMELSYNCKCQDMLFFYASLFFYAIYMLATSKTDFWRAQIE